MLKNEWVERLIEVLNELRAGALVSGIPHHGAAKVHTITLGRNSIAQSQFLNEIQIVIRDPLKSAHFLYYYWTSVRLC